MRAFHHIKLVARPFLIPNKPSSLHPPQPQTCQIKSKNSWTFQGISSRMEPNLSTDAPSVRCSQLCKPSKGKATGNKNHTDLLYSRSQGVHKNIGISPFLLLTPVFACVSVPASICKQKWFAAFEIFCVRQRLTFWSSTASGRRRISGHGSCWILGKIDTHPC